LFQDLPTLISSVDQPEDGLQNLCIAIFGLERLSDRFSVYSGWFKSPSGVFRDDSGHIKLLSGQINHPSGCI